MIPVLSAADVKRHDAEASARGIRVETLMRAAGTAVAFRAAEMLDGAYGRRVVVVCGKGNNGGDGFVAARALAARGASVSVCVVAEEPRGDAERALRAFEGARVAAGDLRRALADAGLVIDALLGVGLRGAPEGVVADAIAAINDARRPVLAVDVPSGLDADTGDVPGLAIDADATVSFGGYKPGLLFAPGAALAGDVTIADIGMPPDLRDGIADALEASDVAALLPVRPASANKYRSGAVLLVCGSRAMPGAAALTSGAAVASGAGLVMLASHPSVTALAVSRVAEIVTIPLDDNAEGVVDAKAIDTILERLARASALAIGPGLSRHPATAEAVRALVATAEVPLVLDADGLNVFEGDVEAIADRRAPTILTPHEGEFARLAGGGVADRMGDARALARRADAVVVLKGAGTVVAASDGRLSINATGGANLASAGTGDVLTGIIAALVARGVEPFDAARAAAFVHGSAADALELSTPSASDILGSLRGVFSVLESA